MRVKTHRYTRGYEEDNFKDQEYQKVYAYVPV